MAVTHTTTTAEPDDPAYDVSADAWNQAHTTADGSFVAAKLAASATDRVFGRSTAGAGNGEEIPLTAAGRALIDDATAADQRTTLGVATDAAAGTGSMRTLGTGATQAAAGNHSHAASGFVGCRIAEATGQSVADNTLTALTSNDAELYDTSAFHDTTTNTTRLTAPATGYYGIGGWAFYTGNATGYREIQIRLNGTTNIAHNRSLTNTVTGLALTTATQYFLTAGDYVELCVLQTSTASLNVFMSGFWIGLLGT